jgi:Tripartite tricarboxylate transporter TctB family
MSYQTAPRSDLRGAFAWIAAGAVAVFASWRMDRLEQQGALWFTAPGLWPGVVGLALAILGGILAWRAFSRARAASWNAAEVDETQLAPTASFALAAAMFFAYALLLVGRGLPFPVGTALFVGAYVFVFRRADRLAGAREGSTRGDLLLAVITAVATAAIVSLAVEQLFFVKLP